MNNQPQSEQTGSSGLLILNADDWGSDRETTQRILECAIHGCLSSASAMVFMDDSDRAAEIARKQGIDTGLHLNLTARFSSPYCPPRLIELQEKVASYLRRHRFAPTLFYPQLVQSFEQLVCAQVEEYKRLYGVFPTRIDGHHHMHLCTNVLLGRLLPPDIIVRRSFSFMRGEKSWFNRFYRLNVDRILARRHRLTDLFFSIAPLEPNRLQRIVGLARTCTVEIETHPGKSEEYKFLVSSELTRVLGDVRIAARFAM